MSNSFPNFQSVMAPSQEIIMNEENSTLQLLAMKQGVPHIVEQAQFSRNEWCVLIPILQAYPGYAAYAVLLAALTDVPRSSVQHRLEEARRLKTLRQELRVVRDAISHADQKLMAFGLTLAPIHEHGYTVALLQENT